MKLTVRVVIPLLMTTVAITAAISCSRQPALEPEPAVGSKAAVTTGEGSVSGEIRDTTVALGNAKFDGDLAIFSGEGWGFSPSLLVFLFLDDDESVEGRRIQVDPSDGLSAGNPHVHYRWRNPDSGDIDVESVMEGYRLRLDFGTASGGVLPGTIEFEVPGEATSVSGTFRAQIIY